MQSPNAEFTFDFGQSRRTVFLIVLVLLLLGHKPLLLFVLLAGAYYLHTRGQSDRQKHTVTLKKKHSPPTIRCC